MIDIEGDETRIGGSRNIGVITELWSTTTVSYSDVTDAVIEIHTDNPGGWERWINEETDLDISDNELENGLEIGDITDLSIRYSTVNIEIST